jgi:hypothetical protein
MNTEQYIAAQAAKYPSHGAAYFAFYAGRNDAADGIKPDTISDAALNAEYRKGFRSMRSEMRLDADTEWDAD